MERKAVKTGAVTIKKIMEDNGLKVNDLANLMSQRGFNINSKILSGKLHRDTFTLNEYVLIADILNCDVKTISRIDNTEYKNECDEELQKQKKQNSSKKQENKDNKGEEAEEVQ